MRRYEWLPWLCLLVGLIAFPAAARIGGDVVDVAGFPADDGTVSSTRVLDSGVKLNFVHLPHSGDKVRILFEFAAGIATERPNQYHSAHIIEHLLATVRVPVKMPSGTLTYLPIGAGISQYDATYEVSTDRKNFRPVLKAAASALLGLSIDQADLKNEKSIIQVELIQDQPCEPGRLMARHLGDRTTESMSASDAKKAFANLGLDGIREYYRQWYRPETLTIHIAGDLNPEVAREALNDAFASYPSSSPQPVAVPKSTGDFDHVSLAHPCLQDVNLFVMLNDLPTTPGFDTDVRLWSLQFLQELLGNRVNSVTEVRDGTISWLSARAATGIAVRSVSQGTAPWWREPYGISVSAIVPDENLETAIAAIGRMLGDLSRTEDLPEGEFEAIKRRIASRELQLPTIESNFLFQKAREQGPGYLRGSVGTMPPPTGDRWDKLGWPQVRSVLVSLLASSQLRYTITGPEKAQARIADDKSIRKWFADGMRLNEAPRLEMACTLAEPPPGAAVSPQHKRLSFANGMLRIDDVQSGPVPPNTGTDSTVRLALRGNSLDQLVLPGKAVAATYRSHSLYAHFYDMIGLCPYRNRLSAIGGTANLSIGKDHAEITLEFAGSNMATAVDLLDDLAAHLEVNDRMARNFAKSYAQKVNVVRGPGVPMVLLRDYLQSGSWVQFPVPGTAGAYRKDVEVLWKSLFAESSKLSLTATTATGTVVVERRKQGTLDPSAADKAITWPRGFLRRLRASGYPGSYVVIAFPVPFGVIRSDPQFRAELGSALQGLLRERLRTTEHKIYSVGVNLDDIPQRSMTTINISFVSQPKDAEYLVGVTISALQELAAFEKGLDSLKSRYGIDDLVGDDVLASLANHPPYALVIDPIPLPQ